MYAIRSYYDTCIFDLPTARDCEQTTNACDCTDPANDNPLCQPNPMGSMPTNRTLQTKAKAYPGIRSTRVFSLTPPGVVAVSVTQTCFHVS